MSETGLVCVEEPLPSTALLSVSCIVRPVAWDPSAVVADALQHHAARGDVQTSASVLLVLGDKRKALESSLDQVTQEHWLLAYIELLSRYKLWNVCTQVCSLMSLMKILHEL